MRRTLLGLAVTALVPLRAGATPEDAPLAGLVAAGATSKYRPLAGFGAGAFRVEAPLSAAARYEAVSARAVDRDGARIDPDPVLNTQLRAGLIIDTEGRWSPLLIRAEAEGDLFTGVVTGGDDTLDGQGLPDRGDPEHTLRKAYARVSFGPFLTLGGGFMTSHWGLGLVANDGAHGWTPGSGYLGDPREGDRVLRWLLATGPWTHQRLSVYVAADRVMGDDYLLDGDEADELVGAIVLGAGRPTTGGIYVAHRLQTAPDGAETAVTAYDLYGRYAHRLSSVLKLEVAAEGVLVAGATDLAPTLDHPEHDVLQLGAAVRASLSAHRWGVVLDLLHASGDRNQDDGEQNAFKSDPNYEIGLLLYRHVLAAQTGRAPVTASDPDLVGVPSPDLERYPTRGGASNTLALFPRGWFRLADGLELNGGILFAFAAVEPADPLNTRLAGGAPRDALGGAPGAYYGTEVNGGLRYRLLLGGTELVAGLDGALFQPGSALSGPDGERSPAIYGGRALVRYAL